ncbi:MAG: hypothetical protein U1A77_24000 [Pirellulales bacterium]
MPKTDVISQLVSQRTWDKELNLWVGPERQLREQLDGLRIETLDVLDLIEEDATGDDDEARRQLARAIRQRLKSITRERGQRVVLIVLSAGLLARYGVGVREFYDWFCDDFSMVFLVVEGHCSDTDWPEEVECHPNQLIEYFSETSGLIKQQFGL